MGLLGEGWGTLQVLAMKVSCPTYLLVMCHGVQYASRHQYPPLAVAGAVEGPKGDVSHVTKTAILDVSVTACFCRLKR